ncbi:hypothetical protein [Amycolatopsis sp. NPDC051071]|uniref:hypothetical protein n=1 Tax=Amycolatopsis sp. NPDC051071 TaxID=3154637 RepID=UPI003429C8F7
MVEETVLDALVAAAPTIESDPQKWSEAFCAAYEGNQEDFSAFIEALKQQDVDQYEVEAVEQVLREERELYAVEELCRDGADDLRYSFGAAVDRLSEQAAPAEPEEEAADQVAEPAAAYDRDEAFPWVMELVNAVIAEWDGTDETWPGFQQTVAGYADRQSGGRADLIAATAGFFTEIDAAGPNRIATLQAYGITVTVPDSASPDEAAYNREETFPWIAEQVTTLVGEWDRTGETWPGFREKVAVLVEQASGGRADLVAASTGFFDEIDAAGPDRVATLQAYGVAFPEPDAAPDELSPEIIAELDTVAEDIISLLGEDDSLDLSSFEPEEIEKAIEDALQAVQNPS